MLLNKGELTQVMHVAERMPTGRIRLIRFPAVVDADAVIAGQDPNGRRRRCAALDMDPVMGEP